MRGTAAGRRNTFFSLSLFSSSPFFSFHFFFGGGGHSHCFGERLGIRVRQGPCWAPQQAGGGSFFKFSLFSSSYFCLIFSLNFLGVFTFTFLGRDWASGLGLGP